MNDSGQNQLVRVAVMSDLHASIDKADSWLCIDGADTPLQSPIESLCILADKYEIKADYLVCCGDIGNRAHPASINYGWMQVHKVADKLEAKVIATAGNHDVDSRFEHNSYDAKGHLQSLNPPFPLSKIELNDRFWARNYAIVNYTDTSFAVLNSAAYHGYEPEEGGPEYEHGRIAERTAEAIQREMDTMDAGSHVNIVICHHHPHKHGDLVAEPDYSTMKDGHRLIDILNAHPQARWLIIHGHKHQPRICYAAGSSNAPVIFGAGSFSAKLNPEISQTAGNQFYVMTFNLNEQQSLKLDLAGTFESYDWVTSIGWERAGSSSGLPAFGGFGYTLSRSNDAHAVFDIISKSGEAYMTWGEIVEINPQFKYLLPADLTRLQATLRKNHNIESMTGPTPNESLLRRGD